MNKGSIVAVAIAAVVLVFGIGGYLVVKNNSASASVEIPGGGMISMNAGPGSGAPIQMAGPAGGSMMMFPPQSGSGPATVVQMPAMSGGSQSSFYVPPLSQTDTAVPATASTFTPYPQMQNTSVPVSAPTSQAVPQSTTIVISGTTTPSPNQQPATQPQTPAVSDELQACMLKFNQEMTTLQGNTNDNASALSGIRTAIDSGVKEGFAEFEKQEANIKAGQTQPGSFPMNSQQRAISLVQAFTQARVNAFKQGFRAKENGPIDLRSSPACMKNYISFGADVIPRLTYELYSGYLPEPIYLTLGPASLNITYSDQDVPEGFLGMVGLTPKKRKFFAGGWLNVIELRATTVQSFDNNKSVFFGDAVVSPISQEFSVGWVRDF